MKWYLISFLLLSFQLSSTDEKLLLSKLVLSSSKAYLNTLKTEKGDTIEISDLLVPNTKKLQKRLEKFITKAIDEALLKELKAEVTKYYEDQGYLFAKTIIPAGQEVSNGKIKVLVSLNKINEVKAAGCKYFSNKQIISNLKIQKDDKLQMAKLSNEVEWINQNPFRNTKLSIKPLKGSENKSNISLLTKDRVPIEVSTRYANTGNQSSGNARFYTSLNFGNLFNRSHQFRSTFTNASSVDKLWSLSSLYIIPTPWKGKFEFCTRVSRTTPKIVEKQGLKGKSGSIISKYHQYINRHYQIFCGYELKRSNNFLKYKNQAVFENLFDVSQFLLGLDVNYKYQLGKTCFKFMLYFSPSNMTLFNNDEVFNKVRKGSIANYVYGRIRLDQTINLPIDFKLFISTLFQYANAKLLPSEQFRLGGAYTVRGYNENQVIGDNGLLLKTEICLPKVKAKGFVSFLNNLQIKSFVDLGYTYKADQTFFSDEAVLLASLGPCLRYNPRKNFRVNLSYGFQLKNEKLTTSKAHLSALLIF